MIDPQKTSLNDIYCCANELESELAEYKWTKITDDPDTRPEDLQKILVLEFGHHNTVIKRFMKVHARLYLNDYWRPLGLLDHPPMEENES